MLLLLKLSLLLMIELLLIGVTLHLLANCHALAAVHANRRALAAHISVHLYPSAFSHRSHLTSVLGCGLPIHPLCMVDHEVLLV